MSRRRIVASFLVAIAGTATFGATAPVSAALPVAGYADIGITANRYAVTVCATGDVVSLSPSSGAWMLEIDGTRSDGSVIRESVTGTGLHFRPRCVGIPRYGAGKGAIVATVWFAGVAANDVLARPDYTALATGEGTWNPDTATSFGT